MPKNKRKPLTSTPVQSKTKTFEDVDSEKENEKASVSYSQRNQLSSDINERPGTSSLADEKTLQKYHDLHALRKLIRAKKSNIAKLQQEYEEIRSSKKQEIKLHSLNDEYLHLKARSIVLNSRDPITAPEYSLLLYSWAHSRLERHILHLQELLSFQKDKKKIAFEKKEDLDQLFERQERECTLINQTSHEELLENEEFRCQILQCLHVKLIRRLRRVSRHYYPSAIVRCEHQLEKRKKFKVQSMFSLLKELLIDLKDNSVQPEEWEKSRLVEVDSSVPENYVKLLINENIVKFLEESSSYIKLADR